MPKRQSFEATKSKRRDHGQCGDAEALDGGVEPIRCLAVDEKGTSISLRSTNAGKRDLRSSCYPFFGRVRAGAREKARAVRLGRHVGYRQSRAHLGGKRCRHLREIRAGFENGSD